MRTVLRRAVLLGGASSEGAATEPDGPAGEALIFNGSYPGEVYDSYEGGTNQTQNIDTNRDGLGQSFTTDPSTQWTIKALAVEVSAGGSGGVPVGLIQAHIYAHSGVLGTSSVPTGARLASSPAYVVDTFFGDIGETTAWLVFEFDDYEPALNTNFVWTVEYPDGTSTDFVRMRTHVVGGDAGNASELVSAAWGALASHDLNYRILGPVVSGFDQPEKWSIMHLVTPYAPALPGADSGIIEADKAMMVGAYSGNDYS